MSGCVDMGPSTLISPRAYTAVKTALHPMIIDVNPLSFSYCILVHKQTITIHVHLSL